MPTYNFDGTQKPKNQFDGNVLPERKKTFDETGLGIAKNTIFGLPSAALGVAKDLAQGFARSISSTGISIANATVGKIPGVGYKPSIPAPLPEDNSAGAKFHRFIYGNEDVKDLATRVVEFENTIKESPTAKKFGLDKAALPLAFGGVIGSATLDLIPGGAGEKNAVKALLKETTEEGAIKVLKNIGFTDDVAKKFAVDFADADSDVIVKDLLDNAKAVQGGKVFDTYLSEGTQETVKNVVDDPLVQQAKNFDNPEDFIKSQGIPVYRGGAEDGKYLSTSKEVAEDFAKNRGGTVSEFIIKPEAKIANYADFPEAQYKTIDDYNINTFSQGKDVKTFQDTVLENDYIRAEKWAKDNGFDAIKLPTEGEVRVINSDSLIPRSQLDDVFKQAKSEVPTGVNVDQATIERGLAARERLIQREKTQYLKKFGENTGELRKDIDNVQNYVENLKEVIDNDPAKDLWKRIFRYTRVIKGSGGPSLEVGLDEILARSLKNPKAPDILKRLDTVITEYGYKDLDEATNGIEKWLKSRAQLKDTQVDRAALVREFQEARMKVTDKMTLDKFLNDASRETDELIAKRDMVKGKNKRAAVSKELQDKALAAESEGYTPDITKRNGGVLPPESRGGVKSPELDLTEWKDRGALSLNRETMERNLERIAGKDSEKIKEFIVSPTRKNETDRVRFANDLRKQTKDLIVKKLGIRSGSKEDELVQKLGEGVLKAEELKDIPKGVDMKKVSEASQYFKKQYDILLDKVNAVREKFGYTPIPRRTDYFRHFQEIDDSIRSFGLIFREQDLPTELAGITGVFSPGKPFSTAEMQRKGLSTTYSAIKGFDNYIDTISKQIYHIDSVQRGRALEKYIRKASKEINKLRGKTEEEISQIKLPNFVSNLHDFTNIVAGKKSALDRAFESMAGRPLYGIANWLGRKTSANMIGGNISSAITNFAPLAQSLATTRKMPAIRGLGEGLLAPFKSSDVIDGLSSSYLTRRFPNRNIDLTGTKKAVETASIIFEVVDKFTAKSIVAGKYYDLLGKGVSKDAAMKAADEYAGRVMADRSLGNTPNLFNSQSLRFVTQFQTEVNNIYSFLKHDIPQMSDGSKRKVASALGQFVLYSYLFNSAYQKVTGRRPLLDPIYSGMELLGLTPETEDSSPLTNAKVAAGGIIGQLPFVGGITGGRFPISAGVPNVAAIINGDSTLSKELAKPAYFLIPPAGGLQIKKTIEGLNAYMNKGVDTPSGKKKYKIKQTPENLIKATIFGPSSTDAAQKYYVEQAKKRNKTKGTKKYDF